MTNEKSPSLMKADGDFSFVINHLSFFIFGKGDSFSLFPKLELIGERQVEHIAATGIPVG
jgi:hypothetical protein